MTPAPPLARILGFTWRRIRGKNEGVELARAAGFPINHLFIMHYFHRRGCDPPEKSVVSALPVGGLWPGSQGTQLHPYKSVWFEISFR